VVPAFLTDVGTQLEEVVDVEDVVEDDLTAAMEASSEEFALSFLCALASWWNGIVVGGSIETLSPFAGLSMKGAFAEMISFWALAALFADAMMAVVASVAAILRLKVDRASEASAVVFLYSVQFFFPFVSPFPEDSLVGGAPGTDGSALAAMKGTSA
jgi:hypothetical protein